MAASVLLTLFTSCAGSPWFRYDESQYRVAMDGTDQVHTSHTDFLREWSGSSSSPPGILGELGFFLAIQGQQEEALNVFLGEIDAHPEQTLFTRALMNLTLPQEMIPEEFRLADGLDGAARTLDGEPTPDAPDSKPNPSSGNGEVPQ